VPRGPLPARAGQVVAARAVQVAGYFRRHLLRRRSGRLDGQRQLKVAVALLTQAGPDRLGQQRVPEPQPAADPADQAGVQDGFLGGVAVGQRQGGQLGRGQLAARGGEHLGQLPRRARQSPGRRPDGGPQVLRRGAAARGERPGALHREQRIAVGRTDYLLDGVVGQLRHAAGHGRELHGRQRPEVEFGDLDTTAGQVGQQSVSGGANRLVAPGQHKQHRPGGKPPADVRAQLHAGRIGTVHILGDQEHRPVGRGPLHQP
jgi:hypothetical protein